MPKLKERECWLRATDTRRPPCTRKSITPSYQFGSPLDLNCVITSQNSGSDRNNCVPGNIAYRKKYVELGLVAECAASGNGA
jgi:hypothetical protein